jgi:hypothetical protein
MNMLKRVIASKFVTWGSRSLGGNIGMGVIFLGSTFFFMSAYNDYVQGSLTLARVLKHAGISGLAGAAWGVIVWYTCMQQLVKRKLGNKK